jgi:hypothetical protein
MYGNFAPDQWEGPAQQVQEPVLPTRSSQPTVFNVRWWKIYGAILALMAAASLALGIADVVLTVEGYCSPWNSAAPMYCSVTGEPYIWTWVASGIWCSIPIFLAGIFAMCLSGNPVRWTRVFALLIFLSAIVFAPGMVVLSGIELWRGWASTCNFYTLNPSLAVGSIVPTSNPYEAKFAIPLVIAIIGGIMFVMTAIVTMELCCCMNRIGIYLPGQTDQYEGVQQIAAPPMPPQPIIHNDVYYPARPQINHQYAVESVTEQRSDPFSRYSASLPYMPTRYSNVPNPYGSGVMYGNFASRAQPSSFASDFFKPNPAYFWK